MVNTVTNAHRSLEEFVQQGDLIYQREVLPRCGPADHGKFAAIDIVSGDYELSREELTATDRLLARRPDSQIWVRRVGFRFTHRLRSRTVLATASTAPRS